MCMLGERSARTWTGISAASRWNVPGPRESETKQNGDFFAYSQAHLRDGFLAIQPLYAPAPATTRGAPVARSAAARSSCLRQRRLDALCGAGGGRRTRGIGV